MTTTNYIRLIISLIFLLFMNDKIHSSYCYQGIVSYKPIVEEGKLYMQITWKDGNHISYISQTRMLVADDINLSGFEIVTETLDAFTFATDEAYYMLLKESRYLNPERYVEKIYDKTEVTDIFAGYFFRVKGQWYFVFPKAFEKQMGKKMLPGLPQTFEILSQYHNGHNYHMILSDGHNLYTLNQWDGAFSKTFVSETPFEILAQNKRNGELILKTNKHVCSFNVERGKLVIIPKLTPSQTKIHYQENRMDNYLYDDDTFYEMSYRLRIHDITSEFNHVGKKNGFSSICFSKNQSRISFFDTDSILWVHANISLSNGPTIIFYPLQNAVYLDPYDKFILYKEKVYTDGFDAAYELNAVDTEMAKSLSRLHHSKTPFLTDGKQLFRNTPEAKLVPVEWLTPQARLITRAYHGNFYEDGNRLVVLDHNQLDTPKSVYPITPPLKKTGTAFACREYLLIEGKAIPNIADINHMEFIGSTVRIIRACDNAGTPPHQIDYFYFFRDRKSIYYYYTGLEEMKVIEGLNPAYFLTDNYEHLKLLESHTDQGAERKIIY